MRGINQSTKQKKKTMDKNNPAFNLQKFILSVILVGITLVLGIYISSTMTNVLDTPGVSVTVTNEANAIINSSGYLLSGASAFESGSFTITSARNATAIIGSGNYTVSALGRITNKSTSTTPGVWTGVFLNYTYTFTNQSAASSASIEVVSALSTGTSWISILVVVGFATIILTMLTSGLGSAAREQAAVPYY